MRDAAQLESSVVTERERDRKPLSLSLSLKCVTTISWSWHHDLVWIYKKLCSDLAVPEGCVSPLLRSSVITLVLSLARYLAIEEGIASVYGSPSERRVMHLVPCKGRGGCNHVSAMNEADLERGSPSPCPQAFKAATRG